ncbi:Orphan protein [Pseudoalteromonas mariniglutinosa]
MIMVKILQYRVEIIYSTISILGVGFLVIQYYATDEYFWFLCLSLFCTKVAMGIYVYETRPQNSDPSICQMLICLLFRFF